MHQGNWTCSGCGKAITELPFEPRSTEGLKCRECHSKSTGNSGGGQSAQGERKMVEGDWKCSGCGTDIKSLPFQPRDTSNLKCIDCYKKSKGG
jgi:CxxC-x17-CxxC domain-containing protein